jgi:hypothetical protein
MDVEFDPLKSAANQGKHGIDFRDAQALWSDPALLEISPARPFVSFPYIAPAWGSCSSMNSSEFDRRFDAGDSVLEALDLDGARRTRVKQKRVNVDFPLWMVEQLDREATRLGVTRQSIIKFWLAERLEQGCHAESSQAGSGLAAPQESS